MEIIVHLIVCVINGPQVIPIVNQKEDVQIANYPSCKSYLCCAIKSSDFKESNLKLNIKNSIVSILLNGLNLNILVDFNVGHPLSIFNKTANIELGNSTDANEYSYSFSKYNVSGKKYENNKIKFSN